MVISLISMAYFLQFSLTIMLKKKQSITFIVIKDVWHQIFSAIRRLCWWIKLQILKTNQQNYNQTPLTDQRVWIKNMQNGILKAARRTRLYCLQLGYNKILSIVTVMTSDALPRIPCGRRAGIPMPTHPVWYPQRFL